MEAAGATAGGTSGLHGAARAGACSHSTLCAGPGDQGKACQMPGGAWVLPHSSSNSQAEALC